MADTTIAPTYRSQVHDHLTIAIEHCGKSIEDGVFFVVTATVNGDEIADWLDVEAFFQSLLLWETQVIKRRTKTRPKSRRRIAQRRRCIPLFTCSCGCFGCGGYYVDVAASSESLIWESAFCPLSQEATQPRRDFAFSRDKLRDVAGELIAAIYHAQTLSENGKVGCGYAGDDLVPRLPFYLERYEILIAY